MKTLTQQAVDQTQEMIDHLKNDQFSVTEIRHLLNHPSVLVRTNSFEALARVAPQHPEVIQDLIDAAQAPENQRRIIGVRLSFIAVAALLKTGLPPAEEAAQQLIAAWPSTEKNDLLWYLEAEHLWRQSTETNLAAQAA